MGDKFITVVAISGGYAVDMCYQRCIQQPNTFRTVAPPERGTEHAIDGVRLTFLLHLIRPSSTLPYP